MDQIEAVSSIEGRRFDAAFAVMPWHKMRAALPQICEIQTELLVLVGNDLSAQEFHDYIREHSEVKTLLFAFQVSGGKKEETEYDDVMIPIDLANVYPKAAIRKRNRWMVDRSDILLACVYRDFGGAYDTMQYARRKGVKVINLA